ncbi:MAG: TRAP transporter small permease [Rhodovulum sp.]|jgi:C4-dicarboxylate transporter DctQ subunit|uniref:TRAP transporter small permease n=1 Tax=Rhodovulum sp. FJ3 TaxID=3079053 RepID=UPI000C08E17B|nr:TRAP transporter small permease [Rhodovulum sp. FJ3]MAY31389.1 TRAP transporter permease DctQ [Rhodovulum sp.]MEC8630502.1 TRAP transporter small permease [Pseudomonadota bacterium]MCI5087160.1 TRAP transporter small permease [Rhodovulum sp.]MDV4167762.1 TRAP transporter small permease [Rhodovulum sp. FJ3]MEC8795998.1 TRAP transporter small permease [Pseudomonadota bacterium]|tara:strand:+ start:319 stop:1008 length:690 start_codon:yes stop_codon:yes gene_type:complete
MSGHSGYHPKTKLGHFVNELEETFIALLLGMMTLVTFINVVLRYVFDTALIWGLELTLVLFAWLVLFGISYGFKITAHLGVDAILNIVSSPAKRVLVLISAVVCVVYAGLLLKGAWDYWAPFAGLDATTGRWFPTGFANSRDQAWYETEQLPFPEWLRFIEPLMNEGEAYEKLPRFIPYAILPFGVALILFRIVQASLRIVKGDQDSLIVSHEAEDAVEEAAQKNREDI